MSRPGLPSPATTRRDGSTPRGFRRPLVNPDVDLLFVNDGSQDATSSVLAELRASLGGSGSFVDLAWNVGKGRGGPPGDAPRARRWDRGHRIVRLRPGDPVRGRVRPPAEARSRTHPRRARQVRRDPHHCGNGRATARAPVRMGSRLRIRLRGRARSIAIGSGVSAEPRLPAVSRTIDPDQEPGRTLSGTAQMYWPEFSIGSAIGTQRAPGWSAARHDRVTGRAARWRSVARQLIATLPA